MTGSGRRLQAVVTISGASALGQMVGLLAIPVISRLYTPADFGIYSTILAVSFVVSAVSTLKLDAAVPLPRDSEDAILLLRVSLAIAGLIGLGLTAIAGLVSVSFGSASDGLLTVLWIAPLSGAGLGVVGAIVQVLLRDQKYFGIAVRNVVQPVLLLFFQVVFGFAAVSNGLVFGLLVANLSAALLMLATAGIATLKMPVGYDTSDTRRVVNRYRSFLLANAPASLVNSVGLQIPVMLLTALYGVEVGGNFGMAQRVLSLPMLMVGIAVGQVYLSTLSQAIRAGETDFHRIFYRHSVVLAVGGLVIAVVVAALAPVAFVYILGPDWSAAGQYARALAVALGFQMLSSPLTQTLVALEELRMLLTLDLFRLSVVVTTCVGASSLGFGADEAILALSAGIGSSYVIYWLGARHAVKKFADKNRLAGA